MKGLLFTYFLTFGGSAAALVNPYAGFLVYVAFSILKPDLLWHWSVPAGNYSRIIALSLLAGWALNGFGQWNFGRAKAILGCIIGYWAVLVACAVAAPDQSLAWEPTEAMSKAFLPLVVGFTLINSLTRLKQLIWVLVICQGYLAYEFNLAYYASPLFIPGEFTHATLDNNSVAITMVTSTGLAFFLGMRSPRLWQRLLCFGLAVLMAHVVLFLQSRGGMLSLILTAAVCFLIMPKKPRDYVVFLFTVLVAARLAGPSVIERFETSFKSREEGSDQGGRRLEHWKACIDSMLHHPLGVGPNHWPQTAVTYGLPKMEAHSNWLQTGAELGFPGLFCLLGFYLICMVRLWPYRRQTPGADIWESCIAQMVIAALVGFICAAQFVTIYGVELPYYITLAGAALLKLKSVPQCATNGPNDHSVGPEQYLQPQWQ